jgi:hypothetical protein
MFSLVLSAQVPGLLVHRPFVHASLHAAYTKTTHTNL